MPRRLPPLSALRPFEAAARLESFSRAAEELHLTHGAVSHQVRALEEHLGTPLFARHGKRVVLTSAGRGFAQRVRGALEEIAQAADALRARREDRLGVSVLPSFASRWLMPRLIRFMDAHPAIAVNVIATTALADFSADEIDVAIRFGKGPWPPLMCEKFLDDEYFPVIGAKVYRGKVPRTPKDLLGARIIREDRDLWDQWFQAAGVAAEAPTASGPRFNDSTYALQAAARGEGIALARLSIIGEDLERGTLKRLFDIPLPSPTSYWFVSPKETVGMKKVDLFQAWVRAELAAGPTRALIQPRPKT
ncbi:MAG TPA: transcriptional regulator GcvA [Usitatibacter sp.]|nr:transcriptional regulator GcvA [Usitatibacter sp.]